MHNQTVMKKMKGDPYIRSSSLTELMDKGKWFVFMIYCKLIASLYMILLHCSMTWSKEIWNMKFVEITKILLTRHSTFKVIYNTP